MKVQIVSSSRFWLLVFCAMLLTAGYHSVHGQNKKSDTNNNINQPGVSIPGSAVPADIFEINDPGRYYLVGNRLCKGTGINVNSDNVTIDLMGFALIGPGKDSGENYGINTKNHQNIEIINGTVRDFGDRGIVDKGPKLKTGYKRIINIRALNNGACGICIGGPANLILNCTCAQNGASGICPGYRCRVIGNLCHKNKHHGIHPGRGSIIQQNTATENGRYGIFSFCGSSIEDNCVYMNNESNDPNFGGIRLLNGCALRNNVLRDNKQNNLYVEGTGNAIRDNVITANKNPANGIYFKSNQNLCSDNYLFGNKTDLAGQKP